MVRWPLVVLCLAGACSTEPLRAPSAASPRASSGSAVATARAAGAEPTPTPGRAPSASGAAATRSPVSPAPDGKVNVPGLGTYVFDVSGAQSADQDPPQDIPQGTVVTVEYSDRHDTEGGVELTSTATFHDPVRPA